MTFASRTRGKVDSECQIHSTSGSYVEVRNLVKWFGNDRAVDDISFSIPRGKFLTLLGPSGCGKTTTLMSIAGLHGIDAGTISVGGVIFTSKDSGIFLPPEKRDIGMVFQIYAIWPHMTVAQNVAYPLEIRTGGAPKSVSALPMCCAWSAWRIHAQKPATQLSGGQQQRIALARAIVSRPRLLLFDEPLSNLDLKLREQMRLELKRIQHEMGITSVYVTHDQAEALVMSDEIIVMSKGRIQQKGGPHEIYARPVNAYVSNFIGVANLLKVRVVGAGAPGRGEVEIADGGVPVRLPCRLGGRDRDRRGGDAVGAAGKHPGIARERRHAEHRGRSAAAIFLGNCVDCRVRWREFQWKVLAHPRARLRPGDKVYLRFDPEHTLAVRP